MNKTKGIRVVVLHQKCFCVWCGTLLKNKEEAYHKKCLKEKNKSVTPSPKKRK